MSRLTPESHNSPISSREKFSPTLKSDLCITIERQTEQLLEARSFSSELLLVRKLIISLLISSHLSFAACRNSYSQQFVLKGFPPEFNSPLIHSLDDPTPSFSDILDGGIFSGIM